MSAPFSHAAGARARARGRRGGAVGRGWRRPLEPRVSGVRALGGVPPPAEWVMRLFSAATASRVSVPRSPPPPRHESGFLLRRVAKPSSPSPHLGSPPALAALAPSEDAPAWCCGVGGKPVAPQDRRSLLCGAVAAAVRSPRPSTGRDEPAGQMLQLFAVKCPRLFSREGSVCKPLFPGGMQQPSLVNNRSQQVELTSNRDIF